MAATALRKRDSVANVKIYFIPLVGSLILEEAVPSATPVSSQNMKNSHFIGIAKLSASVVVISGEEFAVPVSDRRKTLLARAPSAARIRAVMARLPSSDEWLNDEHDY